MKVFLLTIVVISSVSALLPPSITGTTPPAIPCPDELCRGKNDGNFEIADKPNYFLQCIVGKASCQPCFPLHLVFSARCNQCLYDRHDACATTQEWKPESTYHCPDKCPWEGPEYSGNLLDPYNPYHYIACWKGVTVGCVKCPSNLQFNQRWNACLFEGKFKTEPEKKEEHH